MINHYDRHTTLKLMIRMRQYSIQNKYYMMNVLFLTG